MRNRANRYLIDREVQKNETYTGIAGTNTQDRAVQESMGAIADRTLSASAPPTAPSSRRAARCSRPSRPQDGGDPPGVRRRYYKLRAVEQVIGEGENWLEAMRPRLFQEPEAITAI